MSPYPKKGTLLLTLFSLLFSMIIFTSMLIPLTKASETEYILNASFENGNVGQVPYNWTAELGNPSIDDTEAHTGSRSLGFDQGERIAQNLTTSAPVERITSIGFWEMHFDWDYYNTTTKTYFRYTDESTTEIPINFTGTGQGGVWTDWAYVDLLSYLESDKTLRGIAIECLADSDFNWNIDDVVLEVSPPPLSLTVTSDPVLNVAFTIDGASHTTPYNTTDTGNYYLVATSEFVSEGVSYWFVYWTVDGIAYNNLAVQVQFSGTENVTATAHYITGGTWHRPTPSPTVTPAGAPGLWEKLSAFLRAYGIWILLLLLLIVVCILLVRRAIRK